MPSSDYRNRSGRYHPHPYSAECPGCALEEQHQRQRQVDSWTRADDARSYCLLAAAVLAACAFLVASLVFEGRLP